MLIPKVFNEFNIDLYNKDEINFSNWGLSWKNDRYTLTVYIDNDIEMKKIMPSRFIYNTKSYNDLVEYVKWKYQLI